MSPLKFELLVDTETLSNKHGVNVNITYLILIQFCLILTIKFQLEAVTCKSRILVDRCQVDTWHKVYLLLTLQHDLREAMNKM
jgi:hypothetical protein